MKALILLLALALVGAPARADLLLGGVSDKPAYVGPGDVLNFQWYYALRALTAATRGNKLVNVCTTITAVDTCADMFSSATTGALVITTIGGAACNTGTQPYNIKTWYDLKGTGADQTQATVSKRAVLTTCNGATTGAQFTSANQTGYNTATGAITQGQPFEVVWAGARTGSFTTQLNVFEGNAGGGDLQDGYYTSVNTAYGYNGTAVSVTASDNVCHVIQVLHNGASGSITVDGGAPTTANMNTFQFNGEELSLGGVTTTRFPDVKFYEGGFFIGTPGSSMYSNIHGFGNC